MTMGDQSEIDTPPVKILGSEKCNFIVKSCTFSCAVRESSKIVDIKKTDCVHNPFDFKALT